MDEFRQMRIVESLTNLAHENLDIAERFEQRPTRHKPNPTQVESLRAYDLAKQAINLAVHLDYFPRDELIRLERRYEGLTQLAANAV
jgi:hypothetical protein